MFVRVSMAPKPTFWFITFTLVPLTLDVLHDRYGVADHTFDVPHDGYAVTLHTLDITQDRYGVPHHTFGVSHDGYAVSPDTLDVQHDRYGVPHHTFDVPQVGNGVPLGKRVTTTFTISCRSGFSEATPCCMSNYFK